MMMMMMTAFLVACFSWLRSFAGLERRSRAQGGGRREAWEGGCVGAGLLLLL